MKAVLDTNVLISSTLWNGSEAQKVLFKLIRSDAKIFLSTGILSEYQKVLKRDFEYSDDEIIRVTGKILSFAELAEPTEKVEAVKDDPDDNKAIECAIASSSDYVVTYDKHLLSLKDFRGVKIVTPSELLRAI